MPASAAASRDIEAAIELYLVAGPRSDSLTLGLALAPEPGAIPGTEQPHLGQRARSALIDGVAGVDDSSDELPEGFDPGVLRTLDRLGPCYARGTRCRIDRSYLPQA